jgi:hypothetical protein
MRKILPLFLFGVSYSLQGQALQSPSAVQTELRITQLPSPSYPPMALAAHVSGDVELKVVVRLDGTMDSVEALSGPPMLKQAAIYKAKQSHVECEHCSEATMPFRIIYRFELGETRFCDVQDGSYPRVTQAPNTVTITERPFGTCDPSVSITRTRVRSKRCLFLWECGWR